MKIGILIGLVLLASVAKMHDGRNVSKFSESEQLEFESESSYQTPLDSYLKHSIVDSKNQAKNLLRPLALARGRVQHQVDEMFSDEFE